MASFNVDKSHKNDTQKSYNGVLLFLKKGITDFILYVYVFYISDIRILTTYY